MRRREFIALSGAALGMWAPSAFAQQRGKRVAIIANAIPVDQMPAFPFFRVFLEELTRQGFASGRNLVVDFYSGKGKTSTYKDLARAVVETSPDAIFTAGGNMAAELQVATTEIPIVAFMSDPIATGLRVASLARPGANVTGISSDAGVEIFGKRLSLLREAKPSSSKFGLLGSSRLWKRPTGAAYMEAAERAKMTLLHVDLGDSFNESSYAAAFNAIASTQIDALLVSDEGEHLGNFAALVNGAAAVRIPLMYAWREIVAAGGLMAYYIDILVLSRYAAGQTAQILRGKNPGEIPIYQPTEFLLVINTKAAQQIGLSLAPTLLARADEVIE